MLALDEQETLTERISDIDQRVHSLETRVAIAETNVESMKSQLTKIESNTTWLLRLVLGAIIMAVLALIFKDAGVLNGL